MKDANDEPWEELATLLETGTEGTLREFISELAPGESAHALAHLPAAQRLEVLTRLSPEAAAGLLEDMPIAMAADLVEDLAPAHAARLLAYLPSAERVDVLSEVHALDVEPILAEMDPAPAQQTRALAAHASDVAGGLMAGEFLSFRDDATAADVIAELRGQAEQLSDVAIQYVYLVDSEKRLSGVLRLRDLLFALETSAITEVALHDPHSLRVDASLAELEDFFHDHAFLGAPVVNEAGVLLGVLHRDAVQEALAARGATEHMRRVGIVKGEELRSMPLRERALGRLSWLSINVVLNVVAASVIMLYEETVAAVIALAVFLPIISDMSGCSGNQAVAVSLRELSLGLTSPRELMHVLRKEMGVGILNGLALGLLLGALAFLWKGNVYLGLVVGSALAVNTVLAVALGGTIPLFLKRLGRDPALAAGPILTTVTDACGFALTLGLATLVLSHLT